KGRFGPSWDSCTARIFCHRSPPVALTLPETLEEGGESGDAPILALPERAPQFTLENLTRAGHRQRIRAHIDAMGAFVPGNPFLTEVDEIDCLNCRPRFHGDYCMDRFPPTCVRNADDRTLKNPGILRHDIFHF